MNEEYFDSSKNYYILEDKIDYNNKQKYWDMAIGLQEVDNLKPSKYLKELVNDNLSGNKTIYEVENEIKSYYSKIDNINYDEYECDLVSTRIVELLNIDKFELSIDYFKEVHKYLFKDIYEFAGLFRNVNFIKHEKILNNDSVIYCDYEKINDSLEYDFNNEKEMNYKNINDVINNITRFTSNIWQVYPFREGNTRTTAVFIEKYLNSLGYNVDNSLFKDKSIYFRNALVRSNYYNDIVKSDDKYLIRFYENLLINKNNELHSKDLVIKELWKEDVK